MSYQCAHCGTILNDDHFGAELLAMRITPKQARILRRLIKAQGAVVHLEQLVHAAYGHRVDGGPLNAEASTKHGVYVLKHRVRLLGWDIINIRGFGYRLVKPQRNVVPFCRCRAA